MNKPTFFLRKRKEEFFGMSICAQIDLKLLVSKVGNIYLKRDGFHIKLCVCVCLSVCEHNGKFMRGQFYLCN